MSTKNGKIKKCWTYIYSEWILHEVLLLCVVVLDGVGVKSTEPLLLQPLLKTDHAPTGDPDVRHKDGEHQRLGPRLAQPLADVVPEELHHPVLLVVLRVPRVVVVDASTTEEGVEETL